MSRCMASGKTHRRARISTTYLLFLKSSTTSAAGCEKFLICSHCSDNGYFVMTIIIYTDPPGNEIADYRPEIAVRDERFSRCCERRLDANKVHMHGPE